MTDAQNMMRSGLPMIQVMLEMQRDYYRSLGRLFQMVPRPDMVTYPRTTSVATTNSANRTVVQVDARETGEQIIPVGTETFSVEKRVVEGKPTIIHRTVVEVPVESEVDLISRSVTIERRPPVSRNAENIISEMRTEVFDTTEVPVIVKGKAILEEVVIRREETVNRQTVRDTIKRDDIQVEQPSRSLVAQNDADGHQPHQHQKQRAKA